MSPCSSRDSVSLNIANKSSTFAVGSIWRSDMVLMPWGSRESCPCLPVKLWLEPASSSRSGTPGEGGVRSSLDVCDVEKVDEVTEKVMSLGLLWSKKTASRDTVPGEVPVKSHAELLPAVADTEDRDEGDAGTGGREEGGRAKGEIGLLRAEDGWRLDPPAFSCMYWSLNLTNSFGTIRNTWNSDQSKEMCLFVSQMQSRRGN